MIGEDSDSDSTSRSVSLRLKAVGCGRKAKLGGAPPFMCRCRPSMSVGRRSERGTGSVTGTHDMTHLFAIRRLPQVDGDAPLTAARQESRSEVVVVSTLPTQE